MDPVSLLVGRVTDVPSIPEVFDLTNAVRDGIRNERASTYGSSFVVALPAATRKSIGQTGNVT